MEVFADRIKRLSPAKRALLEQWRQSIPRESTGTIPQRTTDGDAPLSLAQERLWFLDQLEPQCPFYNVATAVRLKGRLDVAALERAIQAVVDRHDSLRTTFRAIDGRPRQVVAPALGWSLGRDKVHAGTCQERELEWQRLAKAEALKPFDLERGPLIRGTLVNIGTDDHVLLLTMHHIVCDGWSMAVLRQEVAEHYAAVVEGRSPRLEPLEIQYADFAVWQREKLDGPPLQHLLDYWTRQLADLDGPLELPLDFARPAEQTFHGDVCRLRIDATLAASLRRVAQEEDATLFMVLLTAFNVLLSRYSGQRDLCVGTPIANRNQVQLERLIGFFVNTLVVRADLSANPTVREFIAQVRQTTLDAYAHQELPFARLVDELKPERDLSRTPLFQVMFVLQNIPLAVQEIAGLVATEVSFDHGGIANFDLTLNVDEYSDRLDLSLIYNTSLFLPETIEQLLDSYQKLLMEFCGDRDRSSLSLPISAAVLGSARSDDSGDNRRTSIAAEVCIHELIADQSRRTPESLAVVADNETLTYADLDERSNRLARHLVARGIGPDVAVGVYLPRTPELIVSLLGILKAGGAYVPLDPEYPAARLEYMARDAGLRLLVTTSALAEQFPCREIATVLIDSDQATIAAESGAPLPKRVTSRNLAYLIYTSGSTGQPKGVEVEHLGLTNHARQFAERIGLETGDRMLQFLSPSFDAAAEEIFPTLASGAALCLHPEPAELSGATLLDWSRARGVNVLHVPPPILFSLLGELSAHGVEVGRHLKAVVTGGESVRREDAARWRQVTAGQIPFYLAYGVTEATITTTLFAAAEANAASPSPSGILPIGRPIGNTRIYVLDDLQQPVPTGVRGEIYLGGIGVARGYRNRSDLTRERFMADPFDDTPGARMYRTGDAGRFLHDGNVEFLGRLDRQLKVRGYRIEPGEIEAALCEYPSVREAVVVAQGERGSARLVGYVAADLQEQPTASELAGFLNNRLPAHMIPATYVVLEALPRLPNGKIDHKSLPTAERARARREPAAPPQNDVERALVAIWTSVLELDSVGVHDNFFEIGGDSIRSIQVVARARDAGLRFTPKQLFEHQSIAELARVAQTAAAIHAEQGPVTGPLPLTPIQREFFALELADPHHFNQSVLLEVRGRVSAEVIESAFAELVAHHDALRMRFTRQTDSTWIQSGAPIDDRIPWERVDLSAVPQGAIVQAVEQHAAIAQGSLDLGAGPLARAVYFDLGPKRPARLLIAIHHLAVDAVSWRILLEDLSAACMQVSSGRSPRLSPKTTSFAQWARRLEAFADSDAALRERAQWTSLASAADSGGQCSDKRRDENLVADESVVEMSLSAEATAQWLYDSHRAYRTRPHELLIAALVDTLARHSGENAARIDLEGHGREDLFDDVDLSRTVGWFTTLYPVGFRHPGPEKPRELITSVKERLRAINNGGLGFGLLRWMTSDVVTRDALAEVARGDVSFNYLGQFDNIMPADGPFAIASESTGPNRSPRGKRPHVWEIIAHVRGGCLRVAWHFGTRLHRREAIEELAQDYLATLGRLIAHCADPESGAVTPTDFPLASLDQGDLDQLAALLRDSDSSDDGASDG